jgi:hypothetical protein
MLYNNYQGRRKDVVAKFLALGSGSFQISLTRNYVLRLMTFSNCVKKQM